MLYTFEPSPEIPTRACRPEWLGLTGNKGSEVIRVRSTLSLFQEITGVDSIWMWATACCRGFSILLLVLLLFIIFILLGWVAILILPICCLFRNVRSKHLSTNTTSYWLLGETQQRSMLRSYHPTSQHSKPLDKTSSASQRGQNALSCLLYNGAWNTILSQR